MLAGNYNEAITVFHLFGWRGAWSRRALFRVLLVGCLASFRRAPGPLPQAADRCQNRRSVSEERQGVYPQVPMPPPFPMQPMQPPPRKAAVLKPPDGYHEA